MIEDLNTLTLLLLICAGVVAGFINTLAGGGSFLTLPALMMLGMPADVANGTNRVGVLIQSLAGVKGFDRHGALDRGAVIQILIPTFIGSLIGALTASYLPAEILKPVLLTTMIVMAITMVVKPSMVAPSEGTTPKSLSESPSGYAWLFAAGLYGGFIQAGVGFILIVALAGALRYDLVRSNALKMACTALFSIVALAVFVARDQVQWVPGLVLAAAQVVGVQLSVKFALNVSQAVLRWVLLVLVIAVCIAAWFS
ncbi:MAG: sulfite exporter TauE/SafE family protein [Alcanivoracaceae bacterium]|nr:sulfite exporter TauE/SafE family protein [Alcanivoracaceae bacterium]